MKTDRHWCPLIIVVVCMFYLLTLRTGETWSDDYAMYIHEAKNLSEGIPLGETGYLYNPQNPWLGPRLYPPVFPLLLIPGYLIGHVENLIPMKVEIVIFFIGLLVVLWKGLASDLSPPLQILFLTTIGFNPFLWKFTNLIMSDIPFTFMLYLLFAATTRLVGNAEIKRSLWWAPFLGTLTYLCYGMRTIGIVLIPTLGLLSVVYWRRRGRIIALATGFALALCLIQQRFLASETSYGDMFHVSLRSLLSNIATYSWSLSTYWANPEHRILRDVVFVFITLLAVLGYLSRVRSSIRVYELFVPLYLGIVLLYPDPAGARYLIPVFPLYVFYFLEGAEILRKKIKIVWTQAVPVAAFALILLCYAIQFASADLGPPKEGVQKRESAELFAFIRSNTQPDDVIVFRRPRALALFTMRNSSIYPDTNDPAEFCRYFQKIRSAYLVETPGLDDPSFDRFLNSGVLREQLLFSNTDFHVLRVEPEDIERCARGMNH